MDCRWPELKQKLRKNIKFQFPNDVGKSRKWGLHQRYQNTLFLLPIPTITSSKQQLTIIILPHYTNIFRTYLYNYLPIQLLTYTITYLYYYLPKHYILILLHTFTITYLYNYLPILLLTYTITYLNHYLPIQLLTDTIPYLIILLFFIHIA